jgi:hypothetical protein
LARPTDFVRHLGRVRLEDPLGQNSHETVAELFDVSERTYRNWMAGLTVPPAATARHIYHVAGEQLGCSELQWMRMRDRADHRGKRPNGKAPA